ncbi:pyridoxamine 5'-phosphate oxidase family protein [Actinoplanes sp. NPDC051859]|uniref:pyridoxamine 5'-phosphate oxidase family protein n=1 Tax=Actinoplanes sp. NPDC051859 TaxID=3363909 RepID=UPI0037AF21CE
MTAFEEPEPHVRAKISTTVHAWAATFVTTSPFVVVASSGADGYADASPRGGPPGFVRVLDDRTLAIPEEPGNRLVQTFRNLASHPAIGLLFLVPGMNETARINGTAEVVRPGEPGWERFRTEWTHSDRLAAVTVVHVAECYYHCGRASKFSGLWDVDRILAHRQNPPLPRRPPRAATSASDAVPVWNGTGHTPRCKRSEPRC